MQPTVKPGHATSEFRVSAFLTAAIPAANAAFGWHLDPNFIMACVTAMWGFYSLSRGMVKQPAKAAP